MWHAKDECGIQKMDACIFARWHTSYAWQNAWFSSRAWEPAQNTRVWHSKGLPACKVRMRHPESGCFGKHRPDVASGMQSTYAASKKQMLRHLKQIWIAEAMLAHSKGFPPSIRFKHALFACRMPHTCYSSPARMCIFFHGGALLSSAIIVRSSYI